MPSWSAKARRTVFAILFVGLYYRGQRRDTDLEREYLEIYHPINECIPRLRQLPAGHLVHVSKTCYTAEELKTSPYLQRAISPGQVSEWLERACWTGRGAPASTWGLGDPVASDGWGSSQDHAAAGGCCPMSGNLSASGRRWSGPRLGTRPRPPCWIIPGLVSSTWTGAGGSWRSMTVPAGSSVAVAGCRTTTGLLCGPRSGGPVASGAAGG